MKTTILGIEDFAHTIRAGGNIRQDERRFLAGFLTLADLESAVIDWIEKRRFETLKYRPRRFFFFQAEYKAIQQIARAFDFKIAEPLIARRIHGKNMVLNEAHVRNGIFRALKSRIDRRRAAGPNSDPE